MSQSLTLYDIESGLLDLECLRDEALADGGLPEDLAPIDQAIAEYVQREIRKVDGCAAWLRECDMRAQAAEEEAERLRARARLYYEKRDRFKAHILAVMEAVGETRIEGKTSTLVLRKNPPKVEVRQPEMVPPNYRRFTAKLTGQQRGRLISALTNDPDLQQAIIEAKWLDDSKSRIAEALKRGEAVPGCELVQDSRVEVL